MRDLRRPRLNMGDQKSPKLPLDLTVCTYMYNYSYIYIHVHTLLPPPTGWKVSRSI